MITLKERINQMFEEEVGEDAEVEVEEVDPAVEQQPQLKLVEENTICEVEAALLKVAENYNKKVTLSGEKYLAYSLFRMIVDYPCHLSWSRANGIKIARGNYEDWDWFKEANLKPNTEQIKDVVQQAKEFEQRAKRN